MKENNFLFVEVELIVFDRYKSYVIFYSYYSIKFLFILIIVCSYEKNAF